ncbi:Acyl-coenzyme A synthetase/AMP-(fatty) acid ligase [Modicisalibacter ilicicola DSM 19980]|uniref:Acyl-coenzyme A synthetase/AMP-(Fatty) acid ligase n=1 Tax=Modicisalibacter ilicicola DSM 19980 TaxID=1121942 RepID=A0A1M4ZTQ3_9GAMM|nr:AMP-binding protein [Halomonas ilicicola]SHF21351.1 Acyl-coenzyme A synthetase/AMP-(fatty) acid ligase [Halomonas ilicicola DSM 19980]
MTEASLLGAPWRTASLDQPAGWRCDAPAASEAVTWRAFHERIGAWQVLLDTLATPGRRWLLHLKDPLEFAAALIACWERGDSVVLPADDRPDTLAGVDRITHARLGDVAKAHLATPRGASPRWGKLNAERLAVSLYTSGSTGDPQRLNKSFAQLDAELATHARLWPLEGRLVISQVSHQHIYGLLFAILRPLCEGAPMAMSLCRYPETLSDWLWRLDRTRRHSQDAPPGAVLISAPPPLERLPREIDWEAAPRVLKRVHSSGAALSWAASEHACELLGVAVSEIYGSSETGGIAWRIQQQGERWMPLAGVEVRDDCHGALWLRSPFLSSGDWQRQADRISLEGDGFRLLGRSDRILKVGGKRLSLTAMDRALGGHPGVVQARTVWLPERDTRLGAIVQLAPERLPHDHAARRDLIETLRRHLLAAFESTVVPRYWRFVDAWPTDTQGKLSGTVVRRLFRDLEDRRVPRWLGVERQDDDHCRMTLEVPERLRYVQGHFDRHPVVPGVVIVQWIVELAREHLGVSGVFQRLERVKFPTLLVPGERVTLSLALTHDARDTRLAFTARSPRGTHATGRVVFHAQEVNHVE